MATSSGQLMANDTSGQVMANISFKSVRTQRLIMMEK